MDAYPRLAVLAARMLVGHEERPDPINALLAGSPLKRESDMPGPSILGFLACGAVIRRNAYLAAGGFDDVIFFMGEEDRLCLDLATLGWGMAYVDDIIAHHHPSPSRDTLRRRARTARSRLLTTVLRRPWPVVLRATAETFREGRAGWMAATETLRVLPQALNSRRVIPSHVEAARRLLDPR